MALPLCGVWTAPAAAAQPGLLARILGAVTQRLAGSLLVFSAALLLFSSPVLQAVSAGDFQSYASGNWNAPATWQKYQSSAWVWCGGGGCTGTTTPTSADGVITILSGHTVTVTANGLSIDQTTIAAGGKLIVNDGITLTVANATGTDLTVTGTLEVQGAGIVNVATSAAISTVTGSTTRLAPSAYIAGVSYTLVLGANLEIGSPDGIVSSTADTTHGNIRTTSTRSFANGANYIYNGTAGVQSTGTGLPLTPNSLTINNSAGVNLTNASVTVQSTTAGTPCLKLQSGVLNTGSGTVIIPNNAIPVSRTGGWVVGNFQKYFKAALLSNIYEVGTSTSYNPVTVTFTGVSSAGYLIAKANAGFLAGSTLNGSKKVNDNWTLTKPSSGGVAFSGYNYSLTFQFNNPGDIDAAANPNFLIVGQYASAAWTYLTPSGRTSTTTTVSGLTTALPTTPTVNSYQLGEPTPTKLIFTHLPPFMAASRQTPVMVGIVDNSNNPTSSTASVGIQILNNPAGGALSVTTPVNASGGTATFSDLSIDKVGSPYTLRATSAGLTQGDSSAFDVIADNPTRLSIETQGNGNGVPVPTQGVSNTLVAYAVSRDAHGTPGNFVSTVPPTWSLVHTGNVVDGDLTVDSTAPVIDGYFSVRFASAIEDVAAAGGNVWFNETANNNIGLMKPSGAPPYYEFAIPGANAQSRGVAASADGAIWFTEEGYNKIGRIKPDGTLDEFTIPSGAFGQFLAAGPDGNIWFTEFALRIGRIEPNGNITEYPASGSIVNYAKGITAGPNGSHYMWFVEYDGSRVGRINTDTFAIDEYPIFTTGCFPYRITAGPDGNLWFTESAVNKIGRLRLGQDGNPVAMTAADEFTITIPTGANNPKGITAGPDGNIWFTYGDAVGGDIGRILPGSPNTITPYSLTSGGNDVRSVTVGWDGNLWFPEAYGDRIDRLTLGGKSATFTPHGCGTAVIHAAYAGLTADSGTLTVKGVANAAHSTITASPLSITADGTSTSTITVQARDACDQNLTLVLATVAITQTYGVGNLSAVTDNHNGTFTATLTSPTAVGYSTFTATLNGVAVGTEVGATTATVNYVAGPPNKLAFLTQPSDTDAGSIMNSFIVRFLDFYGNPTPSVAHVTLASTPTTTVSGNDVAAVGGQATFSSLSIAQPNTYTLTASSTGCLSFGACVGATSGSFIIRPIGGATHVAFGTQPTDTQGGSLIGFPSTPVTVRLLDAGNNLVTDSTAQVTLAIAPPNTPGGVLSGNVIAAVGGVATFSNLSIDKAGAGYTLTAVSGALTGNPSSTFTITGTAYWINNAAGADGNTGGQASPFASIGHAADIMGGSGTLYVQVGNSHDGTHTYAANNVITAAGTATNRIRILGVANGSQLPLVAGNPSSDVGFDVRGSYVTIDSFEIQNTQVGVYTHSNTGNTISNTVVAVPVLGYGILLDTTIGSVVQDNLIQADSGVQSFFGIWDYAGQGNTIYRNRVANFTVGDGILSYGATNVTSRISQNIVKNCLNGIHVSHAAWPVQIYNNTVDGSAWLAMYVEQSQGADSRNNIIIYHNLNGLGAGHGWAWDGAGAGTAFSSDHDEVFGLLQIDPAEDYNVGANANDFIYTGTMPHSNNKHVDPKFGSNRTDPANTSYYQLKSASQCVNAGPDVCCGTTLGAVQDVEQ